VSATRLSPDGLYYWDGGAWIATLSGDGRHRWNGTEWVPLATGAASQPGHASALADTRVATSWTTPMQFAVAGWYGLQALWVATLPFWYISTMTRYADEMNRRNQQLHPGTPAPPPDLVSNTNSMATAVFYIAIVLVLVIALVAIAGAIKRWTWAFYALLVLLGLEAIWQLLGTLGGLAITAAVAAAGGLTAGPPAWMVGADLGFGVVSAALFAWMFVAMFKRGPWAMTKVNAGLLSA
jgi:hypothetical protein